MKVKALIFLLLVSAVLAGMAAANIAPRPHVDQSLYDQRLPRQLVMVGDANKVVFYSKDDDGEWHWWSMRAADTIVTDANYIWPDEPNDVNSVLFIKESADGEITLDWGPFDGNSIVWDGNDFGLPEKTPWCVIFVDANGYPLSEDPNNFTYYEPNTAFGIGLDNIAEGTYANNYIQVYSLLDFHPTLFNTTIGMGTDDTTTGPNNVRIGHNAGVVLDEGYENTLGGKDAGLYLVDANDNTGWGYKVIGGLSTVGGTGQYPTLQELTAGEIPDTPATPDDTALVGETDVDEYAELQNMSGTGHYNITGDIDLDGETWTPIANFKGVIEGNGYTISNLVISNSSDLQGMFSTLLTGAEIRNLNFADCSITADDVVGLLCAQVPDANSAIILNNITFTDCTLQGEDYIGFLVGQFAGTGTNGTFSNRIYDCDVINCTLNVNTGAYGAGMLIGYYPANRQDLGLSYIVRCTSQGGQVNIATDCTNTSAFVGKITTYPQYSTGGGFYDCYTTTPIVAAGEQTQMGSFCGKIVGWDVVTCYATGDISIAVEDGTAQHGARAISAFAGMYELVEKSVNCYSTGDITIDGSANTDGFMNATGYFGGYAGWYLPLTDANMIRCYSTGDITLIGDIRNWNGLGGFIGELDLGNFETTGTVIQRSWAEGDITLEVADRSSLPNGVGGFIGAVYAKWVRTFDVTIQNCYAWGSIVYTDNSAENVITGGFFGSEYTTQALTLTIDNCYDAQTNIVTGSGLTDQIPVTIRSGGFWGDANYVSVEPNVTDSFWDTDTSSMLTSDYGEGHITSWMMTKSNYTDAGWDFDTIWYMPDFVEPDVHRVTALGAYAAARVVEGADDGLYVGAYSGAYNTTDPNRFFLDELDRGDYAGNQQHGMMYGYFAEDPNDQWLTINADVNMPVGTLDVNAIEVTTDVNSPIYYVGDSGTYMTKDGSDNLTLTDAVTGTKTLAQLGSPTYIYIKAETQAEGDLHLSDGTNWGHSKAYITQIRVETSATDWDLYILQNDNGYAVDDATVPMLCRVTECSGDATLMMNLSFEDEDDSSEVHLYYNDDSGSNTADIYIIGYGLI